MRAAPSESTASPLDLCWVRLGTRSPAIRSCGQRAFRTVNELLGNLCRAAGGLRLGELHGAGNNSAGSDLPQLTFTRHKVTFGFLASNLILRLLARCGQQLCNSIFLIWRRADPTDGLGTKENYLPDLEPVICHKPPPATSSHRDDSPAFPAKSAAVTICDNRQRPHAL